MSHLHRKSILLVACATLLFAGRTLAADKSNAVSFRNDVMPVLSKAGCNAGTCHGNGNGKGGFKLSLRGENPEADFATLTHGHSARRINVLQAERSLILLKPTMQTAHEGGRRFGKDSEEYETLLRWIVQGMQPDSANVPHLTALEVHPGEAIATDPADFVELHVDATFSDGSRRDVTHVAVYEPSSTGVAVSAEGRVARIEFGESTVNVRFLQCQEPVRLAFIPRRPDFVFAAPAPANFIDEHIFAKLRTLQINPSPPADDTAFLRRASLDLLGFVPTADEAREFLADRNPAKRAELIDRYLQRPEFADFWALKWSDLLRNEEKTLDRKGVQIFHAWIRDSIARGKPLDQFARELIASRGSTYTNPEANFYRAMRDPLMRGESTAQLFLGARLQCAKCHNHPFDRWTQDDYYGWANNFARIKYKVLENNRRDKNDSHEFDGEQIVYMADRGEVINPQRGRATLPRFLGDAEHPPVEGQDRLLQLADWVASPRNARFVKTQVDRIWLQMMGRGIVDPVDDLRPTNPAINPRLLDALADEFVASKFDLRHMIRLIMNSRTYQFSHLRNETNARDEANFARVVPRRLSAEQLLDSICRVIEVPAKFNGYPLGIRAGELPGVHALRPREAPPETGDQFLMAFGKPERLQSCECERSNDTTLSQALQLINGSPIYDLISAKGGRIQTLIDAKAPTEKIVDEFFWRALSRPATVEELRKASAHINAAADRRNGLEDVVWALVTSSEFEFRR